MEFEDVRYPYPEKTVRVDGMRVVHVDEGPRERPPVVFLPAAGRGLTHDAKIYPALLEAGHRVVGVDLPGWGKSDKPDASYSVEWYLFQVERFLEALGIDRCVLVGNSLGGLLAGVLAGRLGERVLGAALVAPAGGPVPFVKRQVASYFLAEARLQDVSERKARMAMGQYFHAPVPDLEELVARALAIAQGKGWPDYCRALSRGAKSALAFDLAPHLEAVRAPVLLLWGREDRVCPVSWLHAFEERLSSARSVRSRVFEGCGHFPAIERPEEVKRELLPWLDQVVVRMPK